jgi:tRNA(Arg) A34 adenosine deaminase TadA
MLLPTVPSNGRARITVCRSAADQAERSVRTLIWLLASTWYAKIVALAEIARMIVSTAPPTVNSAARLAAPAPVPVIAAILYAVKNKTAVEGATLYVTLSPCLACSRIIYSMGISKVIYLNSYAQFKGLASDEGVDFLNKFGVTCQHYEGELSNVTHMI